MEMLQALNELVCKRSVQELHVPFSATKKLKNSFCNLKLTDDESYLESKEWLGEVINNSFPEAMVRTIKDFKNNDEACVLIIRGLPTDSDLCATPYSGYVAPDEINVASACHIGIYQLMSIEPISYQSENDALLFRHVVPSIHARGEKSSHGSSHTFGHHVDNPDLPLSCEAITERSGCPEFLSLMAVRSDLRVRSNFVLVDDLLERLSRGVIDALTKPDYQISRPDSFNERQDSVLPILVLGKDGVMYCRYDKENTTPLNEQAAAALIMLDAVLTNKQLQQSVIYQPGDMLIIKNQRLMHSREGFSPRDDGTDRWLVRLFGMTSLDRIVKARTDKTYIGKD
jgi:L-asparagine oxygenase